MSDVDAKKLQQRILKLISDHVDEMEGSDLDDYTSMHLTRYLNSVTDYVENDEKTKKSDLKKLQDLSEEDADKIILEMAEDIKKKDKAKKAK